jgi:alkane 1-monooxygenase
MFQDGLAESSELADGSFVFLLVYGIPGVLILSTILGTETGWADSFAYVPLAVAFILVPAINAVHPGGAESLPRTAVSPAWRLYYRLLPLLAVPLQAVALCVAVGHACSGLLSLLGLLGWTLSTGLFSALLAITVGHELIHRSERLDRSFGGLLLSLVCFGTFKIVHVKIHHRYVATPLDFASARRDQSLYLFLARSFVGNFREAVRYERRKLQRLSHPFWRSELVVWYGLSLLWLALIVAWWGATGGLFFLLQSFLAILILDWTNYIQHYGLTRRQEGAGRYEPVQPHHAWSFDCPVTNRVLLNLLRHGDHHTYPQRPYQALVERAGPAYPYPFGIILLLALVTPAFRHVVHPLLDQLEKGQSAAARY